MSASERIEALIASTMNERDLRIAILDVVRTVVPFDHYVWLLTDPESCVGCLPLADVPDMREIPTLIRLRYLNAENRWSDPASRTVSTLAATAVDGAPRSSWREHLATHRVNDVITTLLRDQFGCWGFIDLWRVDGTAFSPTECAHLAELAAMITTGVRRSLLATFETSSGSLDHHEPAIVLLGDDLRLLTQTAQADTYLRALLPGAGPPVPAVVYNVGAQLLTRERKIDANPAQARLPLAGRWVTVRAARTGPTHGAATAIAVSIEPATPAERTDVYARSAGLTGREMQLLELLVNGADTRSVAGHLFISQHTVQDHLKSIFAKCGLQTRKAIIARATGAA